MHLNFTLKSNEIAQTTTIVVSIAENSLSSSSWKKYKSFGNEKYVDNSHG
jgi:hypothetical protein